VKRRELLIALGGGAVVALPLATRAQQKAMPVIGYLTSTSPVTSMSPVPTTFAAFRLGLGDAGYVEGQNVVIDTARPMAIMISCPPWLPTSSAARSI